MHNVRNAFLSWEIFTLLLMHLMRNDKLYDVFMRWLPLKKKIIIIATRLLIELWKLFTKWNVCDLCEKYKMHKSHNFEWEKKCIKSLFIAYFFISAWTSTERREGKVSTISSLHSWKSSIWAQPIKKSQL